MMSMLSRSQARLLEIDTPLGPDVFIVQRFSGNEGLGRLSEYQVSLVSKRKNIGAKDILGKSVTVRMDCGLRSQRFFNGYVTRFALLGEVSTTAYKDGLGFAYQMTVRPWLWFLTRTSTCQIFQDKDVPTVIQEVMARSGFAAFSSVESRLNGSYQSWEYCVQYRETDFNFISRLMEQEGIYYWFEHAQDKHVMVLADDMGTHEPHPLLQTIEFNSTPEGMSSDNPYVTAWDTVMEIQPGNFATDDYDFKKPKAELAKAKKITRTHDQAEFEIYDYPGEYVEPSEGEHYAQMRIEELQSQYEVSQAGSNAQQIEVGRLITLTKHPLDSLNQEYLITAASFQVTDAAPSSGGGEQDFSCSFTVIPKGGTPFRSSRQTPKPIVQGPQTAVVVGKSGEEIWTDEYGRVKVQFHWDRYGQMDENSSCWIRVSQPWAGKSWGAVALPRIGQEVIVSFLEGDPDWPIITGRVYNADQMPPYALPANQTQTGIKSRSSPGGGTDNFNEIRFEDKKGEELVYVHAERNLTTMVEQAEARTVGASRSTSIQKDETLVIKEGNRSETLEKGNDSLTVSKGNVAVGVTEGNVGMTVDQGNVSHEAPAGLYSVKAKEILLEATSKITLKIGGSTLVMEPGKVDLKSPQIKVNGDTMVEVKAGATLTAEAGALLTIKGTLVKIN
ncbi:MAG: type VI secretion system tip protein VgrG [Thiobacillus sp.]|nr:type VI secretion system tip protein VgrG [Thiobacillus sp.]